ncbi:MAG: hypothetical protein MR681_06190 [Prevotella sp.]|nr:hypothetical protein [Prevotella sp.]
MTLLLCNSNMFVPIVLTQVLSEPKKQFIIFTDQNNISILFSELALTNIIVKFFKTEFTLGKLKVQRRELLTDLQYYNIHDIFFYHTEYGEAANWLLLYFRDKANIYFSSPFGSFPLSKTYSLKSLLMNLKRYVLYGYFSDMLVSGNRVIPSLPKAFYKKIKAKRKNITVKQNLVNSAVFPLVKNIGSCRDTVLLVGGIDCTGIDTTKYLDVENQIIKAIGIERIVIKCHPRFNDLYGLEKDLPAIPSYIPMNLLIPFFRCFVGYGSTVLSEAAKLGVKSISTINIIPAKSKSESIKKVLDMKLSNKGIIYYPENVNKLKELLQ